MPSPIIIGVVALVVVVLVAASIYFATQSSGSPPSGSPPSGSSPGGSPSGSPAPAPAPAPASALSGYTGPVSGFDYPYNDLGNWPTSDPNQCASYCASNPNCKLFVTATDSQNCWTKSAAQYKTPSTTRNVYPKVGYTLP